jgi:hypothetical protein
LIGHRSEGSIAIPPVIAIGVTLLLGAVGCETASETGGNASAISPPSKSASLSGTIHCGPVRECRGDAFLVYTPIGGKVLMVSPTPSRSTSWVRSQLRDERPLTIHGLDEGTLSLHHYAIDADQLDFDVPVARSEAE